MSYARQTFECPIDTYSATDIRGRVSVIQDLATWLIGLNIGFSLSSEEGPTSTSYTSTSCLYTYYLKWKNSDHFIKFFTKGGIYTTTNTTTKIDGTTNVQSSPATVTISTTTVHRLYASIIYNSNGFILLFNYASDGAYPTLSVCRGYIFGQLMEDFSNTSSLSEYIYGSSSVATSVSGYSGGNITGNDESQTISTFTTITADAVTGIEKAFKAQINNTNWQFKNIYSFTNLVAASQYNVITFVGNDYWVLSSAAGYAIIVKIT